MSKLTRICSLALSSAAILAMHPAPSDAHTLSISRAQTAAAPRVGELIVDLTWPLDSSRITPTWGRHTRHSRHIVELRVILTERYEQCNETLGPPTESGETEGPFCENESTEACFRIGAIYRSKTTRKVKVGLPKRIDCESAYTKKRSRGAPAGPRGS